MDLLSCLLWLFYISVTFYFLIIPLISKSKSSSNTSKLPPGPTPLPILGNLLKILPNISKPHKYFAELARVYGPIMCLKLGFTTTIVISSPSVAKQVLKNNHMFSSNPYVPMDATRAHEHDKYSIGSLPPSSPMWRTLRKIYSNRLLGEKTLDSMQVQRFIKVQELLNYVAKCAKEHVSIDVGMVVYDASYNMMSTNMFSSDYESDYKIREIKDLMDEIISEIGRPNIADCYPILKVFDPQGIRYRLTKLSARLFKLFDEIIEERLKLRKDRLKSSSASYNDLLDVVLDIMEQQKDEISREYVHHLLLDFLGAATDTTSRTIEWAMAELFQNPQVLHKCQQEIDNVVNRDNMINESNVSQLPYLNAIIKETFRLHPAAPLLLPRIVENETEINGYIVPKNAQVFINVWAIGRDSRTWANPESFYPERFLDSDMDVKGQHYELIPFSAGRKMCPGLPLAMRMVTLTLASLISSFNWKIEEFQELHEEFFLDDKFGITIKKAKPLRAYPISRT